MRLMRSLPLRSPGAIFRKPVLTCWIGGRTAREGRTLLQQARLASYETRLTSPWPHLISPDGQGPTAIVRAAIGREKMCLAPRTGANRSPSKVAAEGRPNVERIEAKHVSQPMHSRSSDFNAKSPEEPEAIAGSLLANAPRVVVKLISKSITHSPMWGRHSRPPERRRSSPKLQRNRARSKRVIRPLVDGFAVQPMIDIRPCVGTTPGITRRSDFRSGRSIRVGRCFSGSGRRQPP